MGNSRDDQEDMAVGELIRLGRYCQSSQIVDCKSRDFKQYNVIGIQWLWSERGHHYTVDGTVVLCWHVELLKECARNWSSSACFNGLQLLSGVFLGVIRLKSFYDRLMMNFEPQYVLVMTFLHYDLNQLANVERPRNVCWNYFSHPWCMAIFALFKMNDRMSCYCPSCAIV